MDVFLVRPFHNKEIGASKATEVKREEGLHRLAADLFGNPLWYIGRDENLGFAIDILGAVVIEFVAGGNFAYPGNDWLVVCQNGAFNLAAAEAASVEDLPLRFS